MGTVSVRVRQVLSLYLLYLLVQKKVQILTPEELRACQTVETNEMLARVRARFAGVRPYAPSVCGLKLLLLRP